MISTLPTPSISVDEQQLRRTWSAKSGFAGWFSVVNHQDIGRRYIITAFVFLLIGGLEALLMRLQLASRKIHFSARTATTRSLPCMAPR